MYKTGSPTQEDSRSSPIRGKGLQQPPGHQLAKELAKPEEERQPPRKKPAKETSHKAPSALVSHWPDAPLAGAGDPGQPESTATTWTSAQGVVVRPVDATLLESTQGPYGIPTPLELLVGVSFLRLLPCTRHDWPCVRV